MKRPNTACFGLAVIAGFLACAEAQQFEVASVKKVSGDVAAGAKSVNPGRGGGAPSLSIAPGQFHYTASAYLFILRAYGITSCGELSTCAYVAGAPEWMKMERYQILANVPAGTPAYTPAQFNRGEAPELQKMLQALLAARFSLKLHHETRDVPVYALGVARNGPKPALRKGSGEMVQQPDGTRVKDNLVFFQSQGPADPNVHLVVKNRAMREFTDILSSMTDRPVVDRTGLRGEFDFTIDYEKDPDAAPGNPQLVGPGFFAALQEQLGLKLESIKAPVDVLVIDRVERASAN